MTDQTRWGIDMVQQENKAKAHAEQKSMRDELAFCNELHSLSNARVVLRNEKNEEKIWRGRK